jgi:hypothetical protein
MCLVRAQVDATAEDREFGGWKESPMQHQAKAQDQRMAGEQWRLEDVSNKPA